MFTLPKLTYAYNALEPSIDAETMEIHHSKHHQGYADKLNKSLENHPKFLEKKIETLLSDLQKLPPEIKTTVQNNGGGYANHSLFWSILSPNAKKKPTGKLLEKINSTFGNFTKFKEEFSVTTASQFGSGWGWLIKNPQDNLEIITTANQNSPLSRGLTPLMTVDIWEHAYYLKYQNRRPDYLKAIWNVIDWEQVEKNLAKSEI